MESKDVRYALLIFWVLVTWGVAFLVGYERSESILLSTAPTEVISVEGKDIPAKLIRGGERGVLFMSVETKKLNFLQWEMIKKIVAF
jgi:hypothetical protein